MPLTNAQLDELGAALAFARPDTCYVQRRSTGVDAGGAPVDGWSTVAIVNCRLEASRRMPVEPIIGGKVANLYDYSVILPRGTTVRADDRIVAKGATYEVIGVPGLETYYAELEVKTRASDGVPPGFTGVMGQP